MKKQTSLPCSIEAYPLIDDILARFDCDPLLGTFTYRAKVKRRNKGDVAGSVKRDGYVRIQIGGKSFSAHRLMWLVVHRELPAGQIDHKNGVKTDNRISNLRDVTQSTNMLNIHAACRGNSAGMRGVTLHKKSKKYQASIKSGGRSIYLGLYETAEAANAVYVNAKRVLESVA